MKTKVGPAKSTEEIKDFRHCDLELGGAGVDQAVVYLFRVDYQAKELVEASRTYTDPQGRFEMLTPAGLEVQIFVDTMATHSYATLYFIAKLYQRLQIDSEAVVFSLL